MAKVKFTPRTIREAEKDGADDTRLFVLNRSNPAGNINFNVTDSAGERVVVTVPLTSSPVDLSNFVEKPSILRNPDFRRMVSKTAIVLIDNDEGEEFITKDPRGIAETKRIYQVIEEGAEEMEAGLAQIQQDLKLKASLGVESENPFIESIVLRSKKDEEDVADLISEVDSKKHTLSKGDFEYLAAHAGHSDLKEYASQELEELEA